MSNSGVIPWAKPSFNDKERQYLEEVLISTWVSGGKFVDHLEEKFADYHGSRFAVTVSNGTTALHLAYLALGIGRHDEVVIPGYGFMAAANVAIHVGATPVFTEVNPKTWCLTAELIERFLSPRTKAIVAIHTYGNVCEMEEILELAGDYGLTIIEDSAEAFSSRYKGRLAGSMGTLGCFSLQAAKTITTGEGGVVITNNQELHQMMRLYRNHGMANRTYWHEVAGHNFRLTNLQAAVGCAQMEKLDGIISQRQRVLEKYKLELARFSGLTLQHFPKEVDPVVWAIAVKLDPQAYPQGRDRLIEQLKEMQIETRPGFYAASLQKIYSCRPLPVCEEISRNVLSLPTFTTLKDEQIEYVCKLLINLRR